MNGTPPPGTKVDADKTWVAYYDPNNGRITVVPSLRSGETVLGALLHELCHAARPGADHGEDFGEVAAAVGLRRPWTRALRPRKSMARELRRIARELGPYPSQE